MLDDITAQVAGRLGGSGVSPAPLALAAGGVGVRPTSSLDGLTVLLHGPEPRAFTVEDTHPSRRLRAEPLLPAEVRDQIGIQLRLKAAELVTPVYHQVVAQNASRRAALELVNFDRETGEINPRLWDVTRPLGAGLDKDAKSASPAGDLSLSELRRQMYAMQDKAARLVPGSRIARCTRYRAGSVVDVRISTAGQAYYGGLQSCGSVWACSVCSARVTAVRRDELQQALDYARAGGLHLSLLTLTGPHGPRDDLGKLQECHRQAYRYFVSGKRRLSALLDELGFIGSIRGQEVTHGQKGWHPHWHVLLFTAGPITEAQEAAVMTQWTRSAARAGLGEVNRGALHLDRSIRLSGDELVGKLGLYICKWGAAEELTRSHVKKAGRGGRSPWQLLSNAVDGDDRAAALWCEYERVYKGAKQLVWSKGLRELMGLKEVLSDDEAAALEPEGWTVAAELTPVQWRAVRRAGLRAELLEVATTSNDAPLCYSHAFRAEQVVKEWLASLLRV